MDVDITSDEYKAIKSSLCPVNKPYLCTFLSESPGLCKAASCDCDKRIMGSKDTVDDSIFLDNLDEVTKRNILKPCTGYELIASISENNPEKLPTYADTVKILSWNMTGDLFNQTFPDMVRDRIDKIYRIINDNNPDIVMFQNMDAHSISELKEVLKSNNMIEKFTEYNPNGSIYLLTKYRPSKIDQFLLKGNIDADSDVMFVAFDDLFIVNFNLGTDSKLKDDDRYWFHFSRCYTEQIKTIRKLMNHYHGRTALICGSIDSDLNDHDYRKKFPEIQTLSELQGHDMWKLFHPSDPGFTIDDEINSLASTGNPNIKPRLNKQSRSDMMIIRNYDRKDVSQLKSKAIVSNIKIVGDNGYIINNSNRYYNISKRFGLLGEIGLF